LFTNFYVANVKHFYYKNTFEKQKGYFFPVFVKTNRFLITFANQ